MGSIPDCSNALSVSPISTVNMVEEGLRMIVLRSVSKRVHLHAMVSHILCPSLKTAHNINVFPIEESWRDIHHSFQNTEKLWHPPRPRKGVTKTTKCCFNLDYSVRSWSCLFQFRSQVSFPKLRIILSSVSSKESSSVWHGNDGLNITGSGGLSIIKKK